MAKQRLEVLARSNDGFEIAEMDLRLRGPGEVLGTRQSGLPDLALASLSDDGAVLDEARQTAQAILDGDPTLGEASPLGAVFGSPAPQLDRIGTPQLMARPWHPMPIHDNGEPLLAIPLPCCAGSPIPTKPLVLPYSAGSNPFQLRQSVVERLLDAQQVLRDQAEPLQLLIFDAFRPLAVQQFMVDHTRALPGVTEEDVMALWAEPSADPTTPPPHSTGAAVDHIGESPGGHWTWAVRSTR